jgi:hypothetical protein
MKGTVDKRLVTAILFGCSMFFQMPAAHAQQSLPEQTQASNLETAALRVAAVSTNCVNGNGLYCGGDGVTGNRNTLFRCTNGTVTEVGLCATVCEFEPAGVPDQCAACPNGNGLYCGGVKGINGNRNTLYHCSGGILSVAQICGFGCISEPAGVPDVCACGSGSCVP